VVAAAHCRRSDGSGGRCACANRKTVTKISARGVGKGLSDRIDLKVFINMQLGPVRNSLAFVRHAVCMA
jgi:hypothetical protein